MGMGVEERTIGYTGIVIPVLVSSIYNDTKAYRTKQGFSAWICLFIF